MRKGLRLIKRLVALSLVLLLSIESFAAVVGDNDGAAFITKAEFDSLKSTFQEQIDRYNRSIDNKIDGAIGSYLAGIKAPKSTRTRANNQMISWPINYYHHNTKFENLPSTQNENTASGVVGYDSVFEPSYFAIITEQGAFTYLPGGIHIDQIDNVGVFYDVNNQTLGSGDCEIVGESFGWQSQFTWWQEHGIWNGDSAKYYENIGMGVTGEHSKKGQAHWNTWFTMLWPSSFTYKYELYSDNSDAGAKPNQIKTFVGLDKSKNSKWETSLYRWYGVDSAYPNGGVAINNLLGSWTYTANQRNTITSICWAGVSQSAATYRNGINGNSKLYLWNKRPCAKIYNKWDTGSSEYYSSFVTSGLTIISENEAPSVSWKEKSLISSSRMYYNWGNGENGNTYKHNLCDGIPVFDTSVVNGEVQSVSLEFDITPNASYINHDRFIVFSKKPISATQYSSLDLSSTDYYVIKKSNGEISNDKLCKIKNGTYLFSLEGVENNDIIYMKIFWDTSINKTDAYYNDANIMISEPIINYTVL